MSNERWYKLDELKAMGLPVSDVSIRLPENWAPSLPRVFVAGDPRPQVDPEDTARYNSANAAHNMAHVDLSALQTKLGDSRLFPCSQVKDGKPCLQQYDGKFDRQDRPLFWYGIDCPTAKKLCHTCLAYWLLAVARNELDVFRRQVQP